MRNTKQREPGAGRLPALLPAARGSACHPGDNSSASLVSTVRTAIPGSQSLQARGRPVRTRRSRGNPVLKGHTAAVAGSRAAHRDQQEATGPQRWEPPRDFWKDPWWRAGTRNATHSLPSCPFIVHAWAKSTAVSCFYFHVYNLQLGAGSLLKTNFYGVGFSVGRDFTDICLS